MHYLISTLVGPEVTVVSTTSTSINISWKTICPEVDEYDVAWERDATRDCREVEKVGSILVHNSTNFNVTELEEGSYYMLTVTGNTNGIAINNSVIGITAEAGSGHFVLY